MDSRLSSALRAARIQPEELDRLEAMGFGNLPVCMAKTQYSLSDDPAKLGRPEGFTVTVSKVKVSAGAGFVVVQTGDIMTMPGLPKVPAAEKIDVDENGVISGLLSVLWMKWDRIICLYKLCWRQPLAVKKDLFLSVIAPERDAGDPLAAGGIRIPV